LTEFIQWFLEVCQDQVGFMAGLFEFDRLAERLKAYWEKRALKPEAFYILERAGRGNPLWLPKIRGISGQPQGIAPTVVVLHRLSIP
jgi:hypothetical protein